MHTREIALLLTGAAGGALLSATILAATSHATETKRSSVAHDGHAESSNVASSRESPSKAASEAAANGAEPSDPVLRANANLVGQIADLRTKIATLEQQRESYEAKLDSATRQLAEATGDGGAGDGRGGRAEFDLTKSDWAKLAHEGTMKFRLPCTDSGDWAVSPGQMQRLGLAPQDATAIRDAFAKSADRQWSVVRPLCAAALGTSAEIADKIGPRTCGHLIVNTTPDLDSAKRHAAAILAGISPMPSAKGPPLLPAERLFLSMGSEMGHFEGDLAQSLGPEEAHRLAFSGALCGVGSTWPGQRAQR